VGTVQMAIGIRQVLPNDCRHLRRRASRLGSPRQRGDERAGHDDQRRSMAAHTHNPIIPQEMHVA